MLKSRLSGMQMSEKDAFGVSAGRQRLSSQVRLNKPEQLIPQNGSIVIFLYTGRIVVVPVFSLGCS